MNITINVKSILGINSQKLTWLQRPRLKIRPLAIKGAAVPLPPLWDLNRHVWVYIKVFSSNFLLTSVCLRKRISSPKEKKFTEGFAVAVHSLVWREGLGVLSPFPLSSLQFFEPFTLRFCFVWVSFVKRVFNPCLFFLVGFTSSWRILRGYLKSFDNFLAYLAVFKVKMVCFSSFEAPGRY